MKRAITWMLMLALLLAQGLALAEDEATQSLLRCKIIEVRADDALTCVLELPDERTEYLISLSEDTLWAAETAPEAGMLVDVVYSDYDLDGALMVIEAERVYDSLFCGEVTEVDSVDGRVHLVGMGLDLWAYLPKTTDFHELYGSGVSFLPYVYMDMPFMEVVEAQNFTICQIRQGQVVELTQDYLVLDVDGAPYRVEMNEATRSDLPVYPGQRVTVAVMENAAGDGGEALMVWGGEQ